MARSPTPKRAGKASNDLETRTQQRIADIQGEVLTRLLTARIKVRIDGRSQSVAVLQLIVKQVWSRTLRGDERAKARKILMGFVSLIPRSQRAAVSITLVENDYTAAMAAKIRGDGDAG